MLNCTIGALVADKTETYTVQETDTIEGVLGKLFVHDILSVPVLNQNNECVGIVSVLDLLIYLSWGPYFSTGKLETSNVTRFKNLSQQIGHIIGLNKEGRKLWVLEPTLPLVNLLQPFANGIHRVLVRQPDDTGRKSVFRILSQSDVVKYLFNHREEFGTGMSKTLFELGIRPNKVISISLSTSALDGFRTMTIENVSAVVIVDDKNKAVGSLSASDLRSLTRTRLEKVLDPVEEFLAVQYGRIRTPLTVKLDTKFEDILKLITEEKVHRAWIVDDDNKPIGCLSLSDIINVFAPKV